MIRSDVAILERGSEHGSCTMRVMMMALIIVTTMYAGAEAQDRRGTRFWNLTRYTLTHLQFSPSGQNAWGKNQCENDKDGTVDHDERLRITGIASGRYDVKLADKSGRVCIVKDVEVKEGQIVSIEEKELTNCQQR
jgi:hypothetical protein